MKLHDQRLTYDKHELTEDQIQSDPFAQFKLWYEDAKQSSIKEANAMVIATATADGKPSARIVLLKEINEKGFVFYTNYDSRKGHEVHDNPQGQILFFWDALERQVRIEGRIEKVSAAESDAYFDSRPVESRYGSMASSQSEVIPSREFLEQKLESVKSSPPVRPDDWGGYILIPDYFEFWQGRASRLHDRIFYKADGASWKTGRLSP
ncbi:MAG: pyridoxamine 5-phosphate oxidase [Bacteroidetes bacterium]|nr:pyridoxamine 5-phosphate oxidase [Bacteroidota bacterium]